jgi:dihydrofolate reductase
MKTILVFVSTLDGKVTKWGNPDIKSWSSKSDQDYFKKVWNETKLIIMGSKSYDADPIKPSSNHHFVVMTKHTSKYREFEISGQLEFTDESPGTLFTRFEKEGNDLMLIVGGAQIATSFLKEQLIDELWLTIEPKIFGLGGNFVIEEKLDINLQLLSCERVNKQGTLINKYAVLKNQDKNQL